MRRLALLLLAVTLPACGDDAPPAPDLGAPFEVNCAVAEPGDEARVTAGRKEDGTVILPGGRRLTPAGTLLEVGGFPLAMRLLPGDRYAVVTDGAAGHEALRIVDLKATDRTKAVVSQVDYPMKTSSPADPSLFYGLALTRDGKRLYASTGGHDPSTDKDYAKHYNPIHAFDIAGTPPKLTRNDAATIKMMFRATEGGLAEQRLPSAIVQSSDETLLYVATQGDATLAIVDLKPGASFGSEIGRALLAPNSSPYDLVVDEKSRTAFVSLWAGRGAGEGKWLDGVAMVDVADPRKPAALAEELPTGKLPEAVVLAGGRIYVPSADGDSLTVIDPAGRRVETTVPLLDDDLLGASPNALAVDTAAKRLYVANAAENAVQVLDLGTLETKGRIPTAWYPTAVAVLGDGTVVIASAKGLGLGPSDRSPDLDLMKGVLQVLPRPSDQELAMGDRLVADNLARPRDHEPKVTCPEEGEKRFPLPVEAGGPTPIKHVFLIVRENKTYDAILGDLEGANGAPELTLFPEENTPNAHALARTFAHLDNFYSNAEQSLQGHNWTTGGTANDYVEKGWLTTWGRSYRALATFNTRLTRPGSPSIWASLDRANVAYANYGEVTNVEGAKYKFDPTYPGVVYNLGVPDVDKVQFLIDDKLNDKSYVMPPFNYILLPNDHTYGTTKGKETPQSMVADNDEATGRFVDAVSHSPLWSSSIIFVIEDDPQDGGDHVEVHRSLCLVISPWVKRGHVSSVHHDVPSLLRTISLILGLAPMNRNDANAAAMYDLFASKPDLTPYTFVPRRIPVAINRDDAPLAEESAKIDFTKPDQAPLGRILWKAIRGRHAEPPWGAKDSPYDVERDLDD